MNARFPAKDEPASPPERFAHALLLSIVFLLLYGGMNALTGIRHDVRTCYATWEVRYIPLVPAMLIPYMSHDLIFVTAFLLCRNRSELWTLSLRLSTCMFVAAACYLMFPLKLMYAPQVVPGLAGAVLRFLGSASQYNLAPSLHIALGAILYVHYAQRARGTFWSLPLAIWFTLVGTSTLLTHQHHVIDLPTGAMLAALAAWAWPRERRADLPRFGEVRRIRLALRYGAAAVLCVFIGVVNHGWWWLMLWPATALTIVASAYAGAGPGVYRKRRDGTMAGGARIVLAPVIAGTWLWRLPWRLAAPGPVQVAPGLYLGARLRKLVDSTGTWSVLDLTAEMGESRALRRTGDYFNVPMLDCALPTREQMIEAVEFVCSRMAEGRKVYVHCALGYSRSVAVVVGYLVSRDPEATVTETAQMIAGCRGRSRVDRLTLDTARADYPPGRVVGSVVAPSGVPASPVVGF